MTKDSNLDQSKEEPTDYRELALSMALTSAAIVEDKKDVMRDARAYYDFLMGYDDNEAPKAKRSENIIPLGPLK